MKPYNGFSQDDRARGARWARSTERPKPTFCFACGQVNGLIERHSEDYAAPYGPHIGAYWFCHKCHRGLHLRFARPEWWARYVHALRDGATFAPANGIGQVLRLDSFVVGPKRDLVLFDMMQLSATSDARPRYMTTVGAIPSTFGIDAWSAFGRWAASLQSPNAP